MTGGLLTARQVAELLGVTTETVLRWTRQGDLPAIRLPGTARGRIRYRPDQVDAWIAEHETAGRTPRGVSPPLDARPAAVEATLLASPPRIEEDH